MSEAIQAARDNGNDHGANVGAWVIDGNTSAETATAILRGYDDGDPQVMDMQPSPLSGEWAGEPSPRDVLVDVGLDEDSVEADEALDAYEEGFSNGYWHEVIRAARAIQYT